MLRNTKFYKGFHHFGVILGPPGTASEAPLAAATSYFLFLCTRLIFSYFDYLNYFKPFYSILFYSFLFSGIHRNSTGAPAWYMEHGALRRTTRARKCRKESVL